jgi:hypothetical protein
VALSGRPGNPTAVGAVVTVAFADRTTEMCEVYAGSGYYSQSSPACFFGYPAGNPPLTIRVRWPSGALTQQILAAGVTNVTLAESAPGP